MYRYIIKIIIINNVYTCIYIYYIFILNIILLCSLENTETIISNLTTLILLMINSNQNKLRPYY